MEESRTDPAAESVGGEHASTSGVPEDPDRPTPAPSDPFHPDELASFDNDDTSAGRHLGKMLAIFFLYTIIVMSLAAWWTIASAN